MMQSDIGEISLVFNLV